VFVKAESGLVVSSALYEKWAEIEEIEV